MKINRTKLRPAFSFLLFLFLVLSCKKSDQSVSYSYFVSKNFQTTYNQAYITGLIDVASVTIPDLKSIKPLVSGDVSVYKIVYNTTLSGKSIEASGLICVPVTAGDYPVLSFQNGTNTLFSDAPSVNPSDYTYQLIEFIASMGYIVVIADYPGFGESSMDTHPYLIQEPTVRSLIDLLHAAKEMVGPEFPGITARNEFYLLGYSQGGWATLALHKAIEQDYSSDFNLKGSSCGAGPYDIAKLLGGMVTKQTYPMPEYLAYIVNAYSAYDQFTNPVTDIFNEPYASRLPSLFNGQLASDQINAQLTTSIPSLLNPDFLSGFSTSPKYASVLAALNKNSITGWHTLKPVLFTHGDEDTYVDPSSTENIYNAMIQAGTSPDLIKKQIVTGFGHSDGAVPCMIQGILFLSNLKNAK
jgi:hypothetical protein